MNVHSSRFLIAAVALVMGCSTFMAPAAEEAPATKPASALSAALIANKDTYTLAVAQSSKEFHDQLAALKQKPGRAPPTPAVDLTLRLTNNSDKDISFSVGGDSSQITLQLDGPAAFTIENLVPMTREFRIGKPITLAPGKTYDLPITSLSAGMRGMTQCSYWTEVGEYKLAATFSTALPDGARLAATSDAVKLKIVKQ